MAKASKGKEIILVSSNKVGTLAKVSGVIAGAGGNIKAILVLVLGILQNLVLFVIIIITLLLLIFIGIFAKGTN